jgi:uncharacterized membrane protein
MASPASIHKHPIHPMLIPFPIGLWIFSLVADLILLLGWGGPIWSDVAFYTMAGGILGGLVAAVPGYLDYRSITDPAVSRIGMWHMLINVSTVVLFAVNLWLRTTLAPGSVLPVVLSIVGVGLLSISGWLGGEMVYVHRVAVEPPAPGEAKPRSRMAS